MTPHLSPAITSFFCLSSRKSFCNDRLCLFTPRCFLYALRLGFCVPEPLSPHLSSRPMMSALPQSSADCSILNSVGLSAAFDRADHAESWRESLPGRGNCKHKGPEIETEEKAGVARAQRVGVRAEKAEVSRGLITWPPVHWSEASALGLAQSRCPLLAIVIVTSAKCGRGGKRAEKIPGLEDSSQASYIHYVGCWARACEPMSRESICCHCPPPPRTPDTLSWWNAPDPVILSGYLRVSFLLQREQKWAVSPVKKEMTKIPTMRSQCGLGTETSPGVLSDFPDYSK